jgi:hypothetical protein
LVAVNPDAYLSDLAASVNNLAVRLGEAGRRVKGLAVAEEAAALYRELAGQNPDLFGPQLDDAETMVASLRAQSGG